MKKFELTTDFIMFMGVKLFRIKALISFRSVKAGDLGGFVQKEENLSQEGDAWVCGDAKVCGNARVCGNAWVYGNAWVHGDAWVCGDAEVYGNAKVYGDARVCGNAWVYGDACINREADYATIKGFGREFRTTTFFRQKDKTIGVVCGCFYGTLEEFRKKVKETHRDSKIAKEYLMIADLMEMHFRGEEE